jgi:hypothetical protein
MGQRIRFYSWARDGDPRTEAAWIPSLDFAMRITSDGHGPWSPILGAKRKQERGGRGVEICSAVWHFRCPQPIAQRNGHPSLPFLLASRVTVSGNGWSRCLSSQMVRCSPFLLILNPIGAHWRTGVRPKKHGTGLPYTVLHICLSLHRHRCC